MKTSLTRRLLGGMLAVLLVVTAANCSSPPQSTRSDVPVAADEAVTSSQALTALKLSQMCAQSGTKLLATLDRGAAMTYAQPQTHYNRLLNRCLLSQEGFSSQSRFQLNTKTIYDAIEGNKLADYSDKTTDRDTMLMWCYTTNAKGARADCVDDQRLVNIAQSVFGRYRLDVMNH